MSRSAIVSIHDLRPSSLPEVEELHAWLQSVGVEPVTLLVVPGAGWDDRSLDVLKALVDRGCHLAGHGWSHRGPRPRTMGHRMHSVIISRDQAEHLSRSTDDLFERVRRCYLWFRTVGLPAPKLYVPPAWAMGRLPRSRLSELPFRWYEVLSGFVAAEGGGVRLTPLIGFEADNRFRQAALGAMNRINRTAGALSGRPVRIAIHPADRRLRLAKSLRSVLKLGWRYTSVESVMGTASQAAIGSQDARPV